MIIYDSGRKPISLDKQLFAGGEGLVYSVVGEPDRLVKIYRPEKRTGRETKLKWMLANPPKDPCQPKHVSIAWPEAILYDPDGKFIGYRMPYIRNTKTILHVFNPQLRSQVLPAFNLQYLHRAARNLAATLAALHARDYVVGDLNENNILVTPQALVTVIDIDSVQAKELRDGQIIFYPCPVGRPEYTPPELQGKSFHNVVRQPEHDAFALAVLIFQLLLGGSHPFRSQWLSSGDPVPIEEKIRQGWFPYASRPSGPVAPPSSISLDRLHPSLKALMLQCFEVGHNDPRRRPLPGEWKEALDVAEGALVKCQGRDEHFFSNHLQKCPQCGEGRHSDRVLRSPAPTTPKPLPSPSQPVQVKPNPVVVVATPVSPPRAAPARLPSTVDCLVCGTVNQASLFYCSKCKATLHGTSSCPYCRASIPLSQGGKITGFCPGCGRRL